MTSRDFCYWLQGYFELAGGNVGLTPGQTACVKTHLALVFKHEIDPSMGPAAHQAALDQIHGQQKPLGPAQPGVTVLFRC